MKSLEDFMEGEGWAKIERTNAGRLYISWIKEGFKIDDDDIMDVRFNKKEDNKK